MNIRKCWRRSAALTLASSLLGLAACRSLIGIEDVQEEQAGAAGTAGADASAGNGQVPGAGRANNGGGDATAGKDGAGQSGSSSGGRSSSGGSDLSGTDAGSAGAAGAIDSGPAVHGHVIDFWGHPVADVPIEIGGVVGTTDALGAFSFDAAPDVYDVSFVVTFVQNNRMKTRAWVYQGLTRRDPTLQVYDGSAYKDAPVDVMPNDPATLNDARTLSVASGGPDGWDSRIDVYRYGLDGATFSWVGPTTTQMTAHALIWEKDANSGFPSQFIAFDSTLIALSATATAHSKASFDLSPDTIASGTIAGSVVGTGFEARFNHVFLRYSSNAVMRLLKDRPNTDGFSYLVPSIPNASATLVAGGGEYYTELGVVHKDGLLPNASGINITLPTPARNLVVQPTTDNVNVSATTEFGFKPGRTGNVPFVATFTNEDYANHDDVLYIVGSTPSFKLPNVVKGSYALQPGGYYYWRIETHGTPSRVDEMAGPTGFLDAVSMTSFRDGPSGPRTGDGSYTLSQQIELKIAP